jgi:hypothetical protein
MSFNKKRYQPPQVPVWDKETRRFSFVGELLKEFGQPAENQVKFLDGCKAQGFGEHMANPLPRDDGESEEEHHLRTYHTVQDLNRSLLKPLLRFKCDGTGSGIRWVDLRSSRKRRRKS